MAETPEQYPSDLLSHTDEARPLVNGDTSQDVEMSNGDATAPAQSPAATTDDASYTPQAEDTTVPPTSAPAHGSGMAEPAITPTPPPASAAPIPVQHRASTPSSTTTTAAAAAAGVAGAATGVGAAQALPPSAIIPPANPQGSPTRVYLNTKVTPHLLEAMKYIALNEPANPLHWLGEFLLRRSAEVEGTTVPAATVE